jgi:hypothetical protein
MYQRRRFHCVILSFFYPRRNNNFEAKKTNMTVEELEQEANGVKDEYREEWNTANRIGSLFYNVIQYIKGVLSSEATARSAADTTLQSNINAEATARASADTALRNSVDIYNVTQKVPLQSGYYTAATARAAVPVAIRKKGLIITYQTAAIVWRTEQYIREASDIWDADGSWNEIGKTPDVEEAPMDGYTYARRNGEWVVQPSNLLIPKSVYIGVEMTYGLSVTGAFERIAYGLPVTLTAVIPNGYTWNGWYENGDLITTELTISFVALTDRNLAASAIPGPDEPTEPPTEPPTDAPTEPPTTAAPTNSPTEPPTEAPTEPPTESPS